MEDSAISEVVEDKELKPRSSKTYPTRIQYVGEMMCIFCSCYRRGTFPVCSLGPSWPFTIILMLFASFCLFFLGFMMSVLYQSKTECK